MAFRMGLNNDLMHTINMKDLLTVVGTLPAQPMVSEEDWKLIQEYYISRAPDTLTVPNNGAYAFSEQFKPELLRFSWQEPLVTNIAFDSASGALLVASRSNQLFFLGKNLQAIDSIQTESPVSSLYFRDGILYTAEMGVMDPNDQLAGKVIKITQQKQRSVLIDSLQRPVFFTALDFNNDKKEEIAIANFGNFKGNLTIYEETPSGMQRHVIHQQPGTRNFETRDVNKDGLIDIIALITQGDEHIALFINKGNFNFERKTLLRFPPVYGSSYFEMADMNNDGFEDIVYTNGDNADYSIVFKPYHGVRIFLNDGNNEFTEKEFFPMHGASQVLTADFDGDGDRDMMAIAFFPDFHQQYRNDVLYFENEGGHFTPKRVRGSEHGRWLTMTKADIDADGDDDVLIGALNFRGTVPSELFQTWKKNGPQLLLLRNKLRDPVM